MTATCEHSAFGPNLAAAAGASPWPRTMKVRRWFARGENVALSLLLAAMMALPLVEIALRQFSAGIPSAPEFLRHLTLWVGMLGGAIAARDNRLLALATAHHLPSGRLATFAHRLATSAATAVSAMLAVASSRFVLEERTGGAALAYGVPLWVVQLALPLGFATIAVRIAWQADRAWRRRATTVAMAALLVAGATYLPIGFALAALVLAVACGAPIFVALGGAALILFTGHDVPITAVAIDHYGLVTNPALPVVSLAALFSGWATPVEAAAVTAAYAFVIEVIIHRDLRLGRDCPRVMAEAGVLVGGILLILGVALGLTNYLIDAQVPDALATWSLENIKSPWLFLLGLNIVLIVVGSVVEIFAAIVVVVPLLIPVGLRLGIDPVHLGIIFLANMELGFLAPPIGLNLLLASSRLHRPVTEVARAALPLLGVMFIGVLLITYFPPLTTWLPRLFSRSTP